MMARPLRVLLVEDSERDAALLALHLRRSGYEPTLQRVDSGAAMKQQLVSSEWDVVISDFNIPGFNGYAALQVLKETGRPIPFIVISGELPPAIVDGITSAGAAEYLCKYELKQIGPAIERAMRQRPAGA